MTDSLRLHTGILNINLCKSKVMNLVVPVRNAFSKTINDEYKKDGGW